MTAQSTALDVSYRNIGAILGAVLGLATIGIVYAATSIPELESLLLIRVVLSGNGSFPADPIQAAMVGVPPLAAAMAGWLVAPRALARDRWSGVAMGVTTYLAGILIGPIAAYGPRSESSFVELLAGAPMIAIFASFALFPLLLICCLAGTAWSRLLRLIAPLPDQRSLPSRPFPGFLILVVTSALGLGWFPVAVLMWGSFSGVALVD